MSLKKLSLLFLILFTTTKLFAADSTVNQYNFFVGNFDFSDDKQSALLVGFQHQN